jgi:hypothetical protein
MAMPRADVPIHPNHVPRIVNTEGVGVREDVLCTDPTGEEKAEIRKRNEKQVRKLVPALQRLLQPDETVLFITQAHSPLAVLEQLTAAWWTYQHARSVVVLTNKRILFFPIKSDDTWKESVRSAQWGDVVEVKPKGWIARNVTFTFRNGSHVVYTHFRHADAKKLAGIVASIQLAGAEDQSASMGLVQLCPDCRSVLTPGVYSCSYCGLVFKNEKSMILRSIFLPGGGYFYTGHPLVALIPALVEGFLILELVLLVAAAANKPKLWSSVLSVLMFLAIVWVLETLVTILHGQRYIREYIPEKRDPARAHAVAASAGK